MSNLIQERPITIYTLLFAFIITTILVGVITAIGEIVTINGENVVQNWLEYTYGNHWVGGGIWTIIFFISLSFDGIGKPVVIRGVSDPSYLYLVMPMNR